MTDYEMTKAIAEFMGYGYTRPCEENPRAVEYNADPQESAWMIYCPLDDDGEALALVKRFDMTVESDDGERAGLPPKSWGVTIFNAREKRKGHDTFVVRNCQDLNRAIVECVAKMIAATSTTTSREGKE